MIPIKGLYLDCNPINQPPETWRDARNILFSKIKGLFSNEEGTIIHSNSYPFATAEPIGSTVFPDESMVIYSDGKNGGKDRIGIIDKEKVYTDIIVDNVLGFDKNFAIRASEFDFNYLGQRIITWTDNNVNPKILNIDALPFTLNPDKSLVNSADISDLNLFPEFKQPIITSNIIQGGAVKVGAYSVAFAYENLDGTRTPNTTPFDVRYIVDEATSSGFDEFDGAVPGTLTNKSIQYTLSNVDTRYDKLVMIIIAKINNIVTAFEVKKITISSTNLTITYIGTESTIPLTLDEVLSSRPIYTKVAALAKANNILYHGNLESQEEIDFQSYANNIKIFYNTKLVSIEDINNSQKNNIAGSFPHGGVSAFYIILKLKNGSTSRAFHIPGREGQFGDTLSSSVASGAGLSAKAYQVEDRTNLNGTSYFQDGDTIRATSLAGGSNMGYWENENEVYPANFPVLAGQRVRHHVFPTIRECKERHYSGTAGYGREQLDILGIDVANVNIPAEIQAKIEGWYIAYAERSYANVNTFGNDILLYAAYSTDNTNRIWSSGGNWNLNATQGGAGTLEDFAMRTDYLRGHNFELLRDKPQIGTGGLYIDLELKLRKTGLLNRFDEVGTAGGNISGSGENVGKNPGGIIDLTDTTTVTVTPNSLGTQFIRRISEFRYLPNNIIDGDFYTIKNEETISMKIEGGPIAGFGTGATRYNTPSVSTDRNFFDDNATFPTGGEDTYLITYRVIRTDLFANYDQQKLIATNKIQLPNETQVTKLLGGDTFLSLRSFITTAPRHGADFGDFESGCSVIRAHIAESRYNIGLRYEVTGDKTTKYYPKTGALEFWSNPDTEDARFFVDKDVNPNGLGYSDDFNAVNDYIQPVIYEPSQVLTNKFPYRVIKSGFSGTNPNGLNSWKTYLSFDFYESNRSRGPIEDLFTLDDVLFIHHHYGLFHTLGTERLSLGATEVYIGTGDIFSQVKEPITSKEGFLGTQNIFSNFTYEGTRVWTDQSQGRIFTLNKNGVIQISNDGLYNYFRDNLRINAYNPNQPIVGQCIVGGYDPKYKRLLFTKKSNVDPFTISYSIEDKCWVCYHDYYPNMYLNTSRDILAIGEGNIHRFNSGSNWGKYFGSSPFSWFISLVFNMASDINKQFFNITWKSEGYTNGVLNRTKTLTHLTAETNHQTMARTLLVPHTIFGVFSNTRRDGNDWNFNKIKITDSDPFKKKPLVGEYCVVKYEHDNQPNLDSSQNLIYLYLLSCNARKANQ